MGPTLRELLAGDDHPWRIVAWTIAASLALGAMLVIAYLARGAFVPPRIAVIGIGPAILAMAFALSRGPTSRIHPALLLSAACLVGVVGVSQWVPWMIGAYNEGPADPNGPPPAAMGLIVAYEEIFKWGVAVAAWYLFARADWEERRLRELEVARDALSASNVEARIHALQAQIEPHFLFNTLAHVKWLYMREPATGSRMLERLLDYLRAALPRMRDASSTLGQEVELARAYLEIQEVRFGPRLHYTLQVPPELQSAPFPGMMVMTLVENAIKHGIAPLPGGGEVRLEATTAGERLRVEVRDTGAGLSESAGGGVGIANVRARLAALFGSAARITLGPNAPRGVIASIEVPR